MLRIGSLAYIIILKFLHYLGSLILPTPRNIGGALAVPL